MAGPSLRSRRPNRLREQAASPPSCSGAGRGPGLSAFSGAVSVVAAQEVAVSVAALVGGRGMRLLFIASATTY